MRVKLKWVNRNVRPVTTKIYRNETIKPVDQLGTPLVELDGSITEWLDLTAVRGKTYYYVFATTGGAQVLYSTPLKVEAVYSNGPGPSKLVDGDQNLGYFGTVTAFELMTVFEVQELCGLPQSTAANNLQSWDKWQRNGKILFVPRGCCSIGQSWVSLYAKGLIFGTDDDGPWRPDGLAAKNQLTIITKGFSRFIVRCPTSVDDRNNPTRVVADDATADIRKYSETADLFWPLCNQWMPSSQRFPRRLAAMAVSTSAESRNCFGQEKYKTGFSSAHPSGAGSSVIQDALDVRITTLAYGWKPILELVESDLVIGSTVL